MALDGTVVIGLYRYILLPFFCLTSMKQIIVLIGDIRLTKETHANFVEISN